MNNVLNLIDSYNSKNSDYRYKINLSVMRLSTLNLLKELKLPTESYFIKYFLCQAPKDIEKFGNIARVRRYYLNFLNLKADAFKLMNNEVDLKLNYSGHSAVQKYLYVQGYMQNKYKVPIVLSAKILKDRELSLKELDHCVRLTISLIELEAYRNE